MPDPAPVRILVADDEPAILELVQTVLSLWGYAVELRPDGDAALARALQGGIGLLLIDHQMPAMTGLDVLKRLRAANRPVPAILMSGYLPDALVTECGSLASVRLLPKPFTLQALRDAVTGALGPS